MLESGIAIAAALTPFLIDGVRWLYIAAGGSVTLGAAGATLARLVLAALVLAVPTFLMGGTLSAAARAVTTTDDEGRRRVALLYAVNTIGAVVGVLIAGFVLLERYGNRRTLWMAAALNLVVGLIALGAPASSPAVVAASRAATPGGRRGRRPLSRRDGGAPLVAAGICGFVFLLMELVWYRILSPILGGTTFMFALVLAVALAGIGIGGAIYARVRRGLASAGGLAVTLALQALVLAVPYALGDRVALLAQSLRDVSAFGAHVAGWALVTAIVVLPASIVAGVQFPLLIALLGSGGEDVGRDVGHAYAWNTVGAIAGSLIGGFVLIPRLGTTGCWRLSVCALVVLAAAFAWRARHTWQVASAAIAGVAAIAAIFTAGPTALWRHSGTDAGVSPDAVGPAVKIATSAAAPASAAQAICHVCRARHAKTAARTTSAPTHRRQHPVAPRRGIRTKPPRSEPAIAPAVFHAYACPTSRPTSSPPLPRSAMRSGNCMPATIDAGSTTIAVTSAQPATCAPNAETSRRRLREQRDAVAEGVGHREHERLHGERDRECRPPARRAARARRSRRRCRCPRARPRARART